MDQKRIAIITNSSSGLYSFRRELLETLCASCAVTVITKDTGRLEEIKAIGCSCRPIEMDFHGTNPLKEFKLIVTYRRLLREIRPDAVLTYTIKPNIYGGIACAMLRLPFLANITGLGDAIENSGLLSRFTRSLYRMGLRKASKVFFQNQTNCDFFQKHRLYRGDYEVLPGSGVNLTRYVCSPYPPLDETHPLTLTVVGRITRDKGVREILAAAHELREEKLVIRFIGACQDSFLQAVQEAEAEGIVRYCGLQKNVSEWYQSSHAILHASYHEGMSNALLEAAACGRPVLATDVPGCRETFDEGVSGFGFPPRDAEAIVRTVRRFLALPYEEKKRMGLAGRKKVEASFDRNIVIEKYLAALEKIW